MDVAAKIERCAVHPRRSGLNEWLTIGLLIMPGESYDERYAEWQLSRGVPCKCDNDRWARK